MSAHSPAHQMSWMPSHAQSACQALANYPIHMPVLQGVVKCVEPESLTLTDNTVVPFGLCIWSTGVGPTPFTLSLPFAKTKVGRIAVGEAGWLQGRQHLQGLYATGLPPTAAAQLLYLLHASRTCMLLRQSMLKLAVGSHCKLCPTFMSLELAVSLCCQHAHVSCFLLLAADEYMRVLAPPLQEHNQAGARVRAEGEAVGLTQQVCQERTKEVADLFNLAKAALNAQQQRQMQHSILIMKCSLYCTFLAFCLLAGHSFDQGTHQGGCRPVQSSQGS